MNPAKTVLIGFADSLSAPEVVWSLADAGYRVVAFARSGTRAAVDASRFCQVEHIADPTDAVEQAVDDLAALCRRLERPLVIALDDAALWLIQRLDSDTCVVAGATGRPAEVALDKLLQFQLAEAAGFAVPATREVNSPSGLSDLTLPCIVKPRLAARAIDGRLSRGRSYALANPHDVAGALATWDTSEPMLAQPFLRGIGEGVFGFVGDDGVVCWSGHRRIRMMNPAGSGASACLSLMPDPPTRTAAERFLTDLGWRGMFMIELLRDSEGRLWFMELNGRAWGSMALARRMGFEYPGWTARQAEQPDFVPRPPERREAIVCRHLGREIMHLLFVWRGAPSTAHAWPSRWAATTQVLRWRRSDRWYNHRAGDRRVLWVDAWRTVSSQLRLSERLKPTRIVRKVATRVQIARVRRQQERLRRAGTARRRLARATRILFVCYGNINRSALAEQSLRQLLGADAAISSCGFHRPDRRALDPMMGMLAGQSGIYFPAWSSRTVSRKLVDESDIIFAMEAAHLVRLWSDYPDTLGRSFLLSSVTEPRTIPLEIEDPHRRPPDVYRRCISQVTFATRVISEEMKRRDLAPAGGG